MDSCKQDLDQDAKEAFQSENKKPKWSQAFPVIGKGTLFFNINQSRPFYLVVRPSAHNIKGESWIGLNVGTERVSLLSKKNNADVQRLCSETSSEFFGDNVGIEPGIICTYWLSYDRDHMVVKYGKGYSMKKTTILNYPFEKTEENEIAFFDPTVERKVEMYEGEVNFMVQSVALVEPEVDFDPNPLQCDMQPFVEDSTKANLFELDYGRFVYSSSLPPECKTLYSNVIGADVDLDFVHPNVDSYEFPLTDAIRYSLATEGCALYNKIKEKDTEPGGFGPGLSYLRVTLGKEFGNSPGVPYVLEIWPKSHGSPIHNHGNTYAVIRVLHGGLTVYYYNKMSEKECEGEDPNFCNKELGHFDVKKGDVTWISPRWYQTHRLKNNTKDFCATIQCYAYGTNDNMHWPYFDYLKSCSTIAEFKPDSDFGYKEMYDIVMKEYSRVFVQKQ